MTATQDIVASSGTCAMSSRRWRHLPRIRHRTDVPAVPQDDAGDRVDEKPHPEGYRWGTWRSAKASSNSPSIGRLLHLGTKDPARVLAIFANAQTPAQAREPKSLTTAIDDLDWFPPARRAWRLYEGLLQKNAEEKKSGAGQYFTPRPLIDCIVRLMKPQLGEIIQDPRPAPGLPRRRPPLHQGGEQRPLRPARGAAETQRRECYSASELVPDTHRLCLMNLMLHGIEGDGGPGRHPVAEGAGLPKADLILTNPPFGTKKGGGRPTRDDFTYRAPRTSSCAFVEHIYPRPEAGRPRRRGAARQRAVRGRHRPRIRADLMDRCDLHTILRLPTGIFYAQGVKTNVLFFTREARPTRATPRPSGVYDLRTNIPPYGKTRPLTRQHFADFEAAFGDDPYGKAERQDRRRARPLPLLHPRRHRGAGDNLDITWLRDDSAGDDSLTDPETSPRRSSTTCARRWRDRSADGRTGR